MIRLARNPVVAGIGVLLGLSAAAWILNAQRQPEVDRRTRLRLMPRTLMAGNRR